MRDVRLESETSEVRNVEEGNLINIKHEPSFVGMLSEGSLGVTGSFSDSEFTLVSLLLKGLSLNEGHSMGVLELLILCKFKRV